MVIKRKRFREYKIYQNELDNVARLIGELSHSSMACVNSYDGATVTSVGAVGMAPFSFRPKFKMNDTPY